MAEMNRDVFLSILAMDSYNRGQSLNVTGGLWNATIYGEEFENSGTGFFAIKYLWNDALQGMLVSDNRFYERIDTTDRVCCMSCRTRQRAARATTRRS